MSAIARITRRATGRQFAIYYGDELVANATTVDGLDEALAATEEAGFDRRVYVPGLHIAGVASSAAAQWFAGWRDSGSKRDLTIRDHARRRTIRVTAAFIGAWSEGTWYDLIIDTAALDP